MSQPYNLEWLKREIDAGKEVKYLFFWGHTGNSRQVSNTCFSQWYAAPFTVAGITYRTAEHWMMAQKALLFGDEKIFEQIIASEQPGAAKSLGRSIQHFDEAAWNEWRFEIVRAGNIHKFNQHPELAGYLLHTGERVLVEASPVDTIWGVGLAKDSGQISNPHHWRGLNLLGFALMAARDHLSTFVSPGATKWETVSEQELQLSAAWHQG